MIFFLNIEILSPCKEKCVISLKLHINNKEITSQSLVELLVVTVKNELMFDQHISKLCKSAGCQLNAHFRLKNYLKFEQENVLMQSFAEANFNFLPLSGIFVNIHLKKIDSIKKRSSKFLFYYLENNYFQFLD